MAISSDLLAELDAHRGGRYPQNLKLSLGRYIRASRKAGVTWNSLCLELSLPRQTVKAWSDLAAKAPKLIPVRIPVSPATVWRVLHAEGAFKNWSVSESKKGSGFKSPSAPHKHWHTDIGVVLKS